MPTHPHLTPWSAPAREGEGPRVGVLLLHGFTGSPVSMRPWAEHLAAQGYAVDVPMLPGHGTTWQEMNTTTWAQWYAEAGQAFDRLHADNDSVVVCGLSMGGALSLRLAADRGKDVAGLVLVNPAVSSTNRQLLAVPAAKYLLKSMPGIGNDIKKPGQDEVGYDRTPLRALHSMVQAWKPLRAELPKVTCPLLVFRSVDDHVVDPSSVRLITSTVSSRDVRTVALHDSFHVATLDNDAPQICEESTVFIHEVTRQPTT